MATAPNLEMEPSASSFDYGRQLSVRSHLEAPSSPELPVPSLRIILNGQDAFAKNVLDLLQEDGHTIVAVVATIRPDDPLRMVAIEQGIPVIDLGRVNTKSARKEMGDLNADITVGAFLQKPLKIKTIKVPKHGTVNFHPSDLPKRRGRSAQNWAIIEGDEYMGLSAYFMDEGIDTGPIVHQVRFSIPENATQNSLYKSDVLPKGALMMRDAVRKVAYAIGEGREKGQSVELPLTPQDESLATYDPPITEAHVRIDLGGTDARTVHNKIRGAQNSPGANILIPGTSIMLKLFDSEVQLGPPEKPGGFKVGEETVLFDTKRGLISIKNVREINGDVKGKPTNAATYFNANPGIVSLIR